jgi:hypothetical protein
MAEVVSEESIVKDSLEVPRQDQDIVGGNASVEAVVEVAVPTVTVQPVSLPSELVTAPLPTSSSKINTDVSLILRPICEGWVMGEDWHATRPFSSTLNELLLFINEKRGICQHRIQLRIKGKVVPPSRMRWTFRRMGIADDSVRRRLTLTL